VAEEIACNANPARLNDRNGCCGAVPKAVRVHRLSEGFAGSLSGDPRNSIRGKRTGLRIFAGAASLHFAHYNFVRVHRTLRVTPAMEARVSDRLWSLDELVERTSA